jgi:hypothetical protein
MLAKRGEGRERPGRKGDKPNERGMGGLSQRKAGSAEERDENETDLRDPKCLLNYDRFHTKHHFHGNAG